MLKMLIAALAISPSSKAATAINKSIYVIVGEHWTPEELCYSVHVVDTRNGTTPYASAMMLKGWGAMEKWISNITEWSGVNIDVYENRWEPLEKVRNV